MFVEVADSFAEFMGDGVFVAHNVNFDCGFIAAEHERLGRRSVFRSSAHARACAGTTPVANRTVSASSRGRTTSNIRTIIAGYAMRELRLISSI